MTSKYGYNHNGDFVNLLTGQPPTEAEQQESDVRHNALMRADEAYQTALVKAYGKRAGDIRYQPAKQSTAVRELRNAYVLAYQHWRDTWAIEEKV